MPKVECTAVNELIDRVHNRPLERDSDEELLFSAPPSARQPRGTQPPPLFSTSAPAPIFPIDAPTIPAVRAMPAATPAPVYAQPAYAPPAPVYAQQPAPRVQFPVEMPSEPTEARATMPKIWTRKPEFEPTPREDDLATVAVPRQLPIPALVKRLAIPMGVLLIGGIAVGGMITFRGEGGKHRAAVAASPLEASLSGPAAFVPKLPPPPPPKLEVEALPPPAPAPAQPKLVQVRIESTPPGAAATLLDNGSATPLGSTPVDASIDPSKQYDVVLALPDHTSKIEHLDPAATQRVAVAFDEDVKPAPAPVVAHKHHAKKQAARVAVAHVAKPAKAAPAKKEPTDPIAKLAAVKKDGPTKDAKVATGMLAISTTPPCAILIDGQNSGLTSPQAAISLPAGHHSIRLIAAPQHVNKVVAVDVTPHHTTRLVQDFTK
jgi:hypothetical protein